MSPILDVKRGRFYRKGDVFTTGLQTTYNDTYDIFYSQKYIKTYKIYNNETVDIDLSSWRSKIDDFLF